VALEIGLQGRLRMHEEQPDTVARQFTAKVPQQAGRRAVDAGNGTGIDHQPVHWGTGAAVPSTSWRTSSTKRPAGDHQVDAFRLAGVVVVQEQLRLMRNGLPALS
jgi:hypothetical protein